MSRVYEALRQSELEMGVTTDLSDPERFLSEPGAAEQIIDRSNTGMAWDEIRSLFPTVREDGRVVALTEDNGLGAEKFRLLRTRLRNLREHRKLHKLIITSAVPGEGKTLVAMNLAICLSKHTNERILLLEGDLRKPTLGDHLGINRFPGLGEWASGDKPVTKFLCRFDELQLWVLPAGTAPENPETILQSARFLELYEHLSTCFDWIIVDAPPLLPMSDVSFWSQHADGVLLVARQGKTPKSVLQKGLETLDNPKVIGVVFNDVQKVDSSSYYDHYYHGRKQITRKPHIKPSSTPPNN